MKEMNPKMDSEPYFGVDFKLFKNRNLKVFYNQSENDENYWYKNSYF